MRLALAYFVVQSKPMFIRRTAIKSKKSGEPYFTFRLVETERIGDKVKQHTDMVKLFKTIQLAHL